VRHPVVSEDLAHILAAPLPWERLAGRAVLVSGAAGFIPAYMVETVLALNPRLPRPARVIALVRDRVRAESRFAEYRGRNDLVLLEQDVRVPPPADVRADLIVHAASPSSPKYYGQDPDGTVAANVDGTRNLLDLAARAGAQSFLYLSSSEVYGRLAAADGLAEDQFGPLDPTEPRSVYAESKRMGETICAGAARRGVPATIVRPFHTYGPGLRLDDGRVFADLVSDVVHRRPLTLRSDGSARRAFCYLADAVAGFWTVLFRGEPGRAYNVGDPAGEISVRGLAELLVGLFPERELAVRVQGRPSGDAYLASAVERSCPDISRVRALGWQPATPLAEGFRRTVRSFE